MHSRIKTLVVDELETAYYEMGSGPTVVLLHGGEHGSNSELTWECNFEPLAREYHVVAPDWLGFGKSAKVHDFALGSQRRLLHLQRFLDRKGIKEADFIGCSMGGALAVRALAADQTSLPVRSLTLIGAGGNAPDNAYRRALLDYDCSLSGMKKIVEALFHDKSWAADDAYIQRRFESSISPGAWECSEAARLKNPLLPQRSEFGQVDATAYERITAPVLVIAGERDKLKDPGYCAHLAKRFQNGESHVIPDCGHLPNIECAAAVNQILLRFLRKVNGLDNRHKYQAT
jgi:pimeloyl-ACP methyl ester carboxylesterase